MGNIMNREDGRRMLKEGGVSVNKEKIGESFSISDTHLLNGKYFLIQKGKKNYSLVRVV